MFTAEFDGINSFLVGMSRTFLEHRVLRVTRKHRCWELPSPVMIKINNPLSRWITIPNRSWNMFLPYAESLWLALGRNDLNLVKYYLPQLEEFSDDRKFVRGGYGPRLRCFNGNSNDYKKAWENNEVIFQSKEVDQFYYIIKSFERDPFTRQAVITIGDPPKDCFDSNNLIKETKDLPCTRLLQFMRNSENNKLNLTVYMRSNDFIWGASAVNIFNYTFIQEYFAKMLNLEVGVYYHIANNFHYYEENHQVLVEQLAECKDVKDESYGYKTSFSGLDGFDSLIKELGKWENEIRNKKTKVLLDFKDDFINDWAKVLYLKNFNTKVDFVNPILNQLADTYLTKIIKNGRKTIKGIN
jgi:thymidylate synthase